MRIGISGHQRLREGSHDWGWVEAAMTDVARARGLTVAVSGLAAGADQLFAEVALGLGAALAAVIPCTDYAAGFAEPADRVRYEALLTRAATIDWLDRTTCDEAAYMAAGEHVVDRCELLIALWDGRPAQGLGGTADVVAYAVARGRPVAHIDPQRGEITFRQGARPAEA